MKTSHRHSQKKSRNTTCYTLCAHQMVKNLNANNASRWKKRNTIRVVVHRLGWEHLWSSPVLIVYKSRKKNGKTSQRANSYIFSSLLRSTCWFAVSLSYILSFLTKNELKEFCRCAKCMGNTPTECFYFYSLLTACIPFSIHFNAIEVVLQKRIKIAAPGMAFSLATFSM